MTDAAPAADLAVIDLAGTLVADDGTVAAAFEDAFAELGLTPTEAQRRTVRDTMGQSKIVVFRKLLGDDALAERANRAFEAAYARRIAAGETRPLPHADEVLGRLRAAGLRVCLTTGFSPATRDTLLDALGWADRIDLALSPGDGLRGRPYPDLVLAAVLRLAVDDVHRVAVVGDTVSDLWCGYRAGAGIVAGVLTGAHTREQLAEAPHTHLLDGIGDLPAVLGC